MDQSLDQKLCQSAITIDQLRDAKTRAAASGKPLRDVITELGYSSAVLRQALSTIPIYASILEFFPESTAREHLVLGLTRATDGALIVAVDDSTTVEILKSLRLSNYREFRFLLTSRKEIINVLDQHDFDCDWVDSVHTCLDSDDTDSDTDSPPRASDTA